MAFAVFGLRRRRSGHKARGIALHTMERVITLHDRCSDDRGVTAPVELIVADAKDFELYESADRAYAHRWNDNRAAR